MRAGLVWGRGLGLGRRGGIGECGRGHGVLEEGLSPSHTFFAPESPTATERVTLPPPQPIPPYPSCTLSGCHSTHHTLSDKT